MALPVSAAEARVATPPGNSEADQYFETIPGAAGPTTPNSAKTPQDAVREGTLTAATERALQRRGPAGEAVANVVAQTAPGGKAGGGGRPEAAALGVPDKQGLGALFPLILVATAAGAAGFAAARWRRASDR